MHWNLSKEDPSDDDIAALIVGPTGNLRAPAMRIGKKFVVGFNDEIYEKIFG